MNLSWPFKNFFNKSDPTTPIIPAVVNLKPEAKAKEKPMNVINDAVLNHLNMNTNGALMVTGDWGSGKTYYLKNVLFPEVVSKTKYVPIMISVYGETDKKNIAEKVFFAYCDSKTDKVPFSTAGALKTAKRIAESIPKLSEYVNIEKLLTGNGDNLLKLLPHDELLICFDDVERMSDKININDFLGVVNDLVENLGCKVIIVANAEKFKNKQIDQKNPVIYLEKTVEKTIHFTPEMSDVYDNVIDQYVEDKEFHNYLCKHKQGILKTLVVNDIKGSDMVELDQQLRNIRTIKFALEHFKPAFDIVNHSKDVEQELTIKQIQSLWLFTLAISCEFKNGSGITYTNKKALDEQMLSISDLNILDFISFSEVETEPKTAEEQISFQYAEKLTGLYFNRLDETYFYYEDIYNLITGGKTINGDSLLEDLDKKFYVEDGKVNVAQKLLGQFVPGGYGLFSNDEFSGKLGQLYAYLEEGMFEDLSSYYSATNTLLHFSELSPFDDETIIAAASIGIEKLLKKVDLGIAFMDQLDMLENALPNKKLVALGEYIRNRVPELEKLNRKEEIDRANKLLIDAPKTLFEELTPEASMIRTLQSPILMDIDHGALTKQLPSWQPDDIMALTFLLEARYPENGFTDRLIDEMKFLEVLDSITEDVFPENNLSKFLFFRTMKPRLKIAIKNLASSNEDHK